MTIEEIRAAAAKRKTGGADIASIRAAAAKRRASQQTNVVEQGANGLNEGLSAILGFPVDAATAAINLGITGANKAGGFGFPKIDNPSGGSQSIESVLAHLGAITPAAPQTKTQEYARRIGQETGAMAVPALGTLAKASRAAPIVGAEIASAVGSGIGSQAASDLMPNSPLAEFLGGLTGGLTPLAVSRAARKTVDAPSLDVLKGRQESAYGRVAASGATVSEPSGKRLVSSLKGQVSKEGVKEFLPQPVQSVISKLDALPNGPKVTDIEDMRRVIGNDVAGSADPQARRIGVQMKAEIDDYLKSIQASDLSTGNPAEVMRDLGEGRDMTRRLAKYNDLGGETGAVTKAIRRAKSTGTGGNEINAIRQNVRGILDNPKRRRGYTPDEIKLMEDIVEGTPASNAMRQVGKLSPTTGALQQMTSGGMLVGAATTGNPLLAVPPVVGYFAKAAGESLTKSQVSKLDKLIRNGGPIDVKGLSPGEIKVLKAVLTAQASGALPQQETPNTPN